MTEPHILDYIAADPATPQALRAYAVLLHAGQPLWSTHAATQAEARGRLEAWWCKEGPSRAKVLRARVSAPVVDDLV